MKHVLGPSSIIKACLFLRVGSLPFTSVGLYLRATSYHCSTVCVCVGWGGESRRAWRQETMTDQRHTSSSHRLAWQLHAQGSRQRPSRQSFSPCRAFLEPWESAEPQDSALLCATPTRHLPSTASDPRKSAVGLPGGDAPIHHVGPRIQPMVAAEHLGPLGVYRKDGGHHALRMQPWQGRTAFRQSRLVSMAAGLIKEMVPTLATAFPVLLRPDGVH